MRDTRLTLRKFFDNTSLEGLAGYQSAADQIGALDLSDLPSMNISLLHDITIEPLIPYLQVEGYKSGIAFNITSHNLGEVETLALDGNSALYQREPDVIIIFLYLETVSSQLINQFTDLNQEKLDSISNEVLSRVSGLTDNIARLSSALILIGNFQPPVRTSWGILDGRNRPGQRETINNINSRMSHDLSSRPNTYILDIDRLSSLLGDESTNDHRNWHRTRTPWKPAMFEAMAQESIRYIRPLRGANKKCLVLDCDNVLWGGVAAEVGVSEIHLGPEPFGSPFVSIQQGLRALAARGVTLAVCSKNEMSVVDEVFKNHPHMVLKSEDIATWRVNWNDKADNISSIASELNIRTDSMVFLDDSPFECGRVSQALPDVDVLCMDGNPGNFRKIVDSMNHFDPLTLTDEDLRRTSMYQAESHRQELAAQSSTVEEYLATLDMVIRVTKVDKTTVSRVSQLILKTNQFNITTPRFTESDVMNMVNSDDYLVAAMRLSDVYGDSGLVGAAIMSRGKSALMIDTFLMSCRVLGRGAEDAFFAALTQVAIKEPIKELQARYIPTRKNGLVAGFFPRLGMALSATEDPGSTYNLQRHQMPFPVPYHINLINEL